MNTKRLWIVLLVAALWAFAGCGDKDQEKGKAGTVTKEDVKKETKEAYQSAKAYTKEQIQAYKEQAEAKLAAYAKEIDQLQATAEKLSGDAKAKAEQQIAVLRQKRDAAYEKLKELNASGAGAWEQIKSGLDAALDDLINTYKKVVAEFTKS
jgi:hypothetical protein